MLYKTVTIKDKDYKCRLNAKACVDLERKLKTNPVNILLDLQLEKFPPLGQILMIFHASLLEMQHGIKEDDVFELYDTYCENGKNYIDFINEVIMPVMVDAGLLPNEDEAQKIIEEQAKN